MAEIHVTHHIFRIGIQINITFAHIGIKLIYSHFAEFPLLWWLSLDCADCPLTAPGPGYNQRSPACCLRQEETNSGQTCVVFLPSAVSFIELDCLGEFVVRSSV